MARKAKDAGGRRPAKTVADAGLSAADARYWERVARSTAPLPGRTLQAPAEPPPAKSSEPAASAKSTGPAPPPAATPPRAPAALPELRPGRAAGVDRRTVTRLGRGQLAIEASLDLHGMTQDEAHQALIRFIATARARGKRSVLVITGKGSRPDGGVGVLRAALPRWLNQAPLRAQILAVAQAQPRDGGGGALYLLLKRVR